MARILLIDDSIAVVEILRQWLVASGHEVFAVGVADALAQLRNAPEIDLVLTDVYMPEAEAAPLLRTLRSEHPALACLHLRQEFGPQPGLPAARTAPEHHGRRLTRWKLDAAVHKALGLSAGNEAAPCPESVPAA